MPGTLAGFATNSANNSSVESSFTPVPMRFRWETRSSQPRCPRCGREGHARKLAFLRSQQSGAGLISVRTPRHYLPARVVLTCAADRKEQMMTTDAEHVSPDMTGALAPIAAALFVRIVMGPMTKVLNPLIGKLAGRRHFRMAAQIRHVGRRSGRPYVTPAGARLSGDTIVIPLTFGNRSDWSQNVRAAGGCSIRLNGRDYT